MAVIQFATAENRRGKKKKKVETTAAEYNGLPVGGHNISARLARRGVIGAGNSE